MSEPNKGTAIPVRFGADEDAVLADLQAQTGLTKSELIRRCVRLLAHEVKKRKDTDFIAGLTSVLPKKSPHPGK